MKKIIFVCYGNICRSPMAEYLFKDMVGNKYDISSAATSTEEIGSPVHYGTRAILRERNIDCSSHSAHQLTKKECDRADYIIGMEKSNIVAIKRICGSENFNKVYRLLDFTSNPRDIDDPWYTHDFKTTFNDVIDGLTAFLSVLEA